LQISDDYMKKSAHVCSDHFDKTSFHSQMENQSRRRLKLDALPVSHVILTTEQEESTNATDCNESEPQDVHKGLTHSVRDIVTDVIHENEKDESELEPKDSGSLTCSLNDSVSGDICNTKKRYGYLSH